MSSPFSRPLIASALVLALSVATGGELAAQSDVKCYKHSTTPDPISKRKVQCEVKAGKSGTINISLTDFVLGKFDDTVPPLHSLGIGIDYVPVRARHSGTGGDVSITLSGNSSLHRARLGKSNPLNPGQAPTEILGIHGVHGEITGSNKTGHVNITLEDTSRVRTEGTGGQGVYGQIGASGSTGEININLRDNAMVTTIGDDGAGIIGDSVSSGDININLRGSAIVKTGGVSAYGIHVENYGQDSTSNIGVHDTAKVTTQGKSGHGVYAQGGLSKTSPDISNPKNDILIDIGGGGGHHEWRECPCRFCGTRIWKGNNRNLRSRGCVRECTGQGVEWREDWVNQ